MKRKEILLKSSTKLFDWQMKFLTSLHLKSSRLILIIHIFILNNYVQNVRKRHLKIADLPDCALTPANQQMPEVASLNKLLRVIKRNSLVGEYPSPLSLTCTGEKGIKHSKSSMSAKSELEIMTVDYSRRMWPRETIGIRANISDRRLVIQVLSFYGILSDDPRLAETVERQQQIEEELEDEEKPTNPFSKEHFIQYDYEITQPKIIYVNFQMRAPRY